MNVSYETTENEASGIIVTVAYVDGKLCAFSVHTTADHTSKVYGLNGNGEVTLRATVDNAYLDRNKIPGTVGMHANTMIKRLVLLTTGEMKIITT